jgi:hypothetical protein
MAQFKSTLLIACILFVQLFSLQPLASETVSKSKHGNLRELYAILATFPNLSTSALKQLKNRNLEFFSRDSDSSCELVKTESVQSISYYGVRCDQNLREGLIQFSKNKRHKNIPKGYLRIAGHEKIGRKTFIQIALNSNAVLSKESHVSQIDTEFDWNRKQVTSKKSETKSNPSDSNSNLSYFISIAYDKNRRKESPSGLEIFFDWSCPLKFIEKDESFYWDRTISYVFEITCVKNTPYTLLRVPGNKQGNLVASNIEAKNLIVGDRFYGRLKMRKITNEQAYWEDFKLYYE